MRTFCATIFVVIALTIQSVFCLNPDHLENLKKRIPGTDYDLRGLRAKRVNFSGSNLRFATMQRINRDKRSRIDYHLEELDLRNMDLSHANLDDALLHDCDFSGCDLRNIDATDGSFYGRKLDAVDLRDARLINVDFGNVFMRNSTLKNADCTNANFIRAVCHNSDFSFCTLTGSRHNGAFHTNARFNGANIAHTVWMHARLKGTDFRDTYTLGANFERAHIKNATFERSRGSTITTLVNHPRTVLCCTIGPDGLIVHGARDVGCSPKDKEACAKVIKERQQRDLDEKSTARAGAASKPRTVRK